MTVIPLSPTLRQPKAANVNVPFHLHQLQGHLNTIALECQKLAALPVIAPAAWPVMGASLGAVGVGLRCALGMARTAGDGLMLAALGRAINALSVIQPEGDPATTRELLNRAARALLAAIAEADPAIWAQAEGTFSGDVDGPGGAA